VPVVAERSMYWLGAPGPWADGTSTFGVDATGLRWGFAEGRVGGPLSFHTYIRIANESIYANPPAADVKVTYLKTDGTTVVQTYSVPGDDFITIDANTVPGLQDESFGVVVESTNNVRIFTERSMYWNADGVFWAGGLTTAGTRLP
jgi:hypothetical protein